MAISENTDTKDRILDKSLTLFSEQGYDSTSVAQIAAAVGIKAPSLYKHFNSKRAIFDAILHMLQNRYEKQQKAMHLNGIDARKDAEVYLNMSEKQLIDTCKNVFLFFLHDSFAFRFRKLLTIEQYHSKDLADLYVKQYIDDSIQYQQQLFSFFTKSGSFQIKDIKLAAVEFYAPVFMFLSLCYADPCREKESLDFIELHIKKFYRLHFSGVEKKHCESI